MAQSTEEQKKAEAEAKKAEEAKAKQEAADKKNVAFFKSSKHAGLTVQVQKTVKNPVTGKPEEEVDEQESFTQYYDTFKGDVVRVGYLRTESPKIAERLREDSNVEEIDEKEYSQAVEGDEKHKPLALAPVAAA